MVIQAGMVVMMTMREAHTGPASSAKTWGFGDAHRQLHSRPALEQPSFNWNAPEKYVKLLSFEMEAMNILQTTTYKLTDEEKVLVIKNCLDRQELHLIQIFTHFERGRQNSGGAVFFTR